MRTVLLNLPWRQGNRFGVRAGSRWPFTSEAEENGYINYIPFPFFLACACALLKKDDREAKLIDAIAQGADEDSVIDEVSSYQPGLIVIETSTPSFENDMRIASKIAEANPGSFVALCGPHATTFAEDILQRSEFVDFILRGEYEYILLDLVHALENGGKLKAIPGLAFKDKAVIINRSMGSSGNLDDLPWPERQKEVVYKYNDGFAGMPVPNVQMYSSRGCPFHCIFCLWPQVLYTGSRYRKRNPLCVVDEMEWLVKEFGFKAVYFDDDVFNIDKTHVRSICAEINRRGLKVPWAAMARADLMDENLLSVMSDSGLYAIKYGIESANKKVLGLCGKKLDILKAKKMISYTKKLGIKIHLTFCLGLPGETMGSVQETVDFIKEMDPDSLQCSLATPFPGTDYYRYLEKKGIGLSGRFTDYDGNNKHAVVRQGPDGLDLERLRSDICGYFNFK